MRILIAGCAGFIGSHLSRKLLEEGHDVVGIDNFLTSTPNNIADLFGKKFHFLEYDITHFVYIEGELDAVINLASPASPQDYKNYPMETMMVGSIGTRNLLELARQKKARFLQASTSEIYGDPTVHPQPETYWGNVNPTGMRSMYDEAKRFGEALCMVYYRKYNLDVKIARIFNTYGPWMRLEDGRAIPNFITQALQEKPISIYGDGKQTRSFCYISDLVDGLIRLLKSNFQGVINLGNPSEFTILELAEKIIQLTKSKSKIVFFPLPDDDPKQRKPDIALAKKVLNWEPKVNLEEGLKQTLPWFQKELQWQNKVGIFSS
jgi:dTDP-glucose 4,6-dehydratase